MTVNDDRPPDDDEQMPADLLLAVRWLGHRIGTLTTAVLANRRTIRLVIAGLALDVLLTLAITVVSVALNGTSHQLQATSRQLQAAVRLSQHNRVTIGQLHAAQLVSCANSNNLRSADRGLWRHILAVSSATQPRTAAERRQGADFIAYVNRHFAELNCAKLYPPPK